MQSFEELDAIINAIENARQNFLESTDGLTIIQANFKLSEDQWSVSQITEHMVWAEKIGLNGMSKAIEGILTDKPIWEGVSKNHGLSIEEVVAQTWQEKEIAPSVAEPKWGGTLPFWQSALQSNRFILSDLRKQITEIGLLRAVYPHPLSGPLDVEQRLQFLRFHLERHRAQVERVRMDSQFPN